MLLLWFLLFLFRPSNLFDLTVYGWHIKVALVKSYVAPGDEWTEVQLRDMFLGLQSIIGEWMRVEATGCRMQFVFQNHQATGNAGNASTGSVISGRKK